MTTMSRWLYLVGVYLVTGFYGHLVAATTGVATFPEIADAVFVDLPNGISGNIVLPQTVLGVPVTVDTGHIAGGGAFFDCGFSLFPRGTQDDPGDGDGVCSLRFPSVTFIFGGSVSAFGVTFSELTSQPGRLQVFASPDGTRIALGSIESSGDPVHFVGLLSTKRNIRSAVVSGSGPHPHLAIDGYALSLTPPVPVPEPQSGALFGIGLAVVAAVKLSKLWSRGAGESSHGSVAGQSRAKFGCRRSR